MHIKELEVDNFKSFANNIKIPFLKGFTAVAGPNGSGKSNIIDGILFALGLANSRNLRTEQASDFISNYTKKDETFVKVVLEPDNNSEEEITIARKLKKSSQGYTSTYYLNDKVSTKFDILSKLEKYRITSTLERIKPHYIYNVLTSISYLCEYDPPTAQKALGVFSDYLRSVLSKMDDRSVVPFSEEIKTVKKYISLEKMRFGNRFLVKYVIDAKDFEIPPFTLQPLVENSVKHGLADIDEQGVIEIKTHEDAYGYYIIVSDNGKGFDTAEDESSGEGTKYIKDILSLTVNGLLTIDSVVGKGTVSTIYIPKVNKD